MQLDVMQYVCSAARTNISLLCKTTGTYTLIKDGSDDQPDLTYKYPNEELKDLFKNN